MNKLKIILSIAFTITMFTMFAQKENTTQKEDVKKEADEMSGKRPFELKQPNITKPNTNNSDDEKENVIKAPKISPPKIKRKAPDEFTMEIIDELGGGIDLRKKLINMGLDRKKVSLIQGQNMQLTALLIELVTSKTKGNSKDAVSKIEDLNREHKIVLKELLARDQFKLVKKLKKSLIQKAKNVVLKRLPKK